MKIIEFGRFEPDAPDESTALPYWQQAVLYAGICLIVFVVFVLIGLVLALVR